MLVAAVTLAACTRALTAELLAFGDSEYGQLGDGTTNTRYTPVQIMDSGARPVAAGTGPIRRHSGLPAPRSSPRFLRPHRTSAEMTTIEVPDQEFVAHPDNA